ncbi:MAG: bifunctional nicotinamidase/pyrazinamidase [Verrucomicrobiales bacterium]|nr:bifunctional nicotinamidase/pyrazinamidase [Verrucomicrobiales bacterium]
MKTLIIVDIQNDFLPKGALAVNEGDQIVSIINELIPHYGHVIATQDSHPDDHGSFADNHDEHEIGEVIDLHGLEQVLWPSHCIQGTLGAQFSPSLNTDEVDHIFQKGTDPKIDSYSAFYDNGHRKATGLAEHLREIATSEVHIVGLATDYCVKFTALDAVAEGFKTTLIADACRGVNLNSGDVENAIEEMQHAGIIITTSDVILGETKL